MALIPQQFAQANISIQSKDLGIKPLYIYTDGKQCVSCWRMSIMDRIKAVLFGKVWLCVLSGETQPPVWIDVGRNVLEGGDQ